MKINGGGGIIETSWRKSSGEEAKSAIAKKHQYIIWRHRRQHVEINRHQ